MSSADLTMTGVTVLANEHLPRATMVVSPDIFEQLKSQFPAKAAADA